MIIKNKPQKTLAKAVELKGIGLHSGKVIDLILKPAAADYGFVFVRTDLDPQVEIPALAQYVSKTDRGTTLSVEGVDVKTTEHALAALVGCGINNCRIELNGAEAPILDGSSKPFVEAIQTAGIQDQEALQEIFVVQENIHITDEASGSEILIVPAESTSLTVLIDFETKVLSTQNAVLHKMEDFPSEIASSRTFSFLHELETLLDQNLIKGGDLNNA